MPNASFSAGRRGPAQCRDAKAAHLAMIRIIANRMSLGSALVRLWSVLIVGALLAVTIDPAHGRFAWLAVFMSIAFWLLDGHYLRQGRLFRKMYDYVRALPEGEVELVLDTASVDSEAEAFASVVFSTVPVMFHGTLLVAIAVARCLLWNG